MNLGEFHALVYDEARKGSRMTDVIPGATRRAALWFERNYSLSYMDRFVAFKLNPTHPFPRIAPLDSSVKSIHFVRWVDLEAQRFRTINRIDPAEMKELPTRLPKGYWLDDHQWIWFDAIPPEPLDFEMSYVQYTKWPTDLEAEPWLINVGEDVMLAKTMILLAPSQREPEWLQLYQGMYSEGLVTLINADAELRYHNTPAQMRYVPEGAEDDVRL